MTGDKLEKCYEWQLLVFTCYIQKYYTDCLRIIQVLLNESYAPGLCLRSVLWLAGRTENRVRLWMDMFANSPLGIKCLHCIFVHNVLPPFLQVGPLRKVFFVLHLDYLIFLTKETIQIFQWHVIHPLKYLRLFLFLLLIVSKRKLDLE